MERRTTWNTPGHPRHLRAVDIHVAVMWINYFA
jgi:hypothetical protein